MEMNPTRTVPNPYEFIEDRTGHPDTLFGWKEVTHGPGASWHNIVLTGCISLTSASGVTSLYHYGTGPGIIDKRSPQLGAPSLNAAISAKENIRFLSSHLGISKSDLAKVFDVSRPALYAWINGISEPQDEHAAKLPQVADLVRAVTKSMVRPLYHGYVTKPLPGQTKALLDLLIAKRLDEQNVRSVLEQARILTLERQARLGRLLPEGGTVKGLTEAKMEDILHDNISSLGMAG